MDGPVTVCQVGPVTVSSSSSSIALAPEVAEGLLDDEWVVVDLDTADNQSHYKVDIIGRRGVKSLLFPTLYKVRVSGPGGNKIVWHRYSDFISLDEHFRPHCQQLPPFPEGGVLSKFSDGFVQRRQRGLCALLQGIVAAHPKVEDPVLRRFLGVCDVSIAAAETQSNAVESRTREASEMLLLPTIHSPLGDSQRSMRSSPTVGADGPLPLPVQCSVNLSHSCVERIRGRPRQLLTRHISSQDSCLDGFLRRTPSLFGSPVLHGAGVARRRCFSLERQASPRRDPEYDDAFRDRAVIIARDVARVFNGDTRVDVVRLHILEILRSYARTDAELGYTQGMCFAAAITCLSGSEATAEQRFAELMSNLRRLWLPGFPMVSHGTLLLKMLLTERDPDLAEHFDNLDLDIRMILLSAWLSMFAKWLPLSILIEAEPFLRTEGLAGLLAVTYVVLLHHRAPLLDFRSLDELLPFMSNLVSRAPPENLVSLSRLSLPVMHAHLSFRGA